MLDRPRRTPRQTEKCAAATASTTPVVPPPTPRAKRKADELDPSAQLHSLLQDPKSKLTTMDISDLINASSWNILSPEAQASLKKLLPPTAFNNYQDSLEPEHPSIPVDAMPVDPASGSEEQELNCSIFTDPHFLAAAHTFQDHIYNKWTSVTQEEKVRKYQEGILAGTLAAPWKDETWEREHASREAPKAEAAASWLKSPISSALAGEAAEVKLLELSQNGILRVGDVIAYKRNFSMLNLVVQKDCIIQSIHPKTYALTVLTEIGSTQYLPPTLLLRNPGDPPATTRSMSITSPSMLETGLLDIDGRVERAKRTNGNAWKCFTVWRWRVSEYETVDNERGGRENHGTLFYLRGSYYHER